MSASRSRAHRSLGTEPHRRHFITGTISIRLCSQNDAKALSLVGQATFLETFAGTLNGADIIAHCESQHAPIVYDEWLRQDTSRLWLAETDVGRSPIGYLVLLASLLPIPEATPTDLEVKRIYLLHRFRGKGLGRRLMDEAARSARTRGYERLLLGVYSRNKAAIAFYERLGFHQVGARTFTVGSNVYDDIVLGLDLGAQESIAP